MRISRRNWMLGLASLGAAAGAPALRLPGKVRVALIGFSGHPEEILGPLPGLPDVELVAVSESDPKLMAEYAGQRVLAGVRRYSDYQRMLDRETVDVVAVCNQNGERAAAILACAARQRHIIAEKPLATEMADLERVKRAVADARIRLSMLLPMRFMPVYKTLHRLVGEGAIGEVALITGQKSYKAGERPEWFKHRSSYGGTIPWIGIHMLDLMRWISRRELVEVSTFQNRVAFPELLEMENVTASAFRLDNGGAATLTLDFLRPDGALSHGDDRLRLAGTEGVAEYQEATGVTLLSRKSATKVPPDSAEGSIFVDFLESVYNGKPSILSLADIYRDNEIVLLARQAGERHAIVKL